jgi:hypothetical protein
MTRTSICSAALVASISLAPFAAHAQSAAAKPRSPGEIAVTSNILAQKYDTCRHQAKEQKLSFVRRRIYIHDCVRK